MTALDRATDALQFIVNEDYDITVGLAVFAPDANAPVYRSLNITDDVANGFFELIQPTVLQLLRLRQNGDLEVLDYDAGYKPDPHQLDVIDLTDDPLGEIANVPEAEALPLHGDVDEFIDNVRFYILILSNAQRRVVLFTRYNRNKELLRSKNLIVRLLGEQLERVHEPTFQFSPTIDAFSDDNEMFVVNRSNFEHIFRYDALLRASADESIDAIHDAVPIANLTAFRATCHGHVLKLKKLRNISQKGYLGDLTLEILQETITRYELNIEINDQGELVFETTDPWAILKLLDDSYLDSLMTGLSYETNSKLEL